MIISSKELKDALSHIQYLDFTSFKEYDDKLEGIFYVDLNTRQIKMPNNFTTFALKGEHKAETIWFALNRYFDGHDLYPENSDVKGCWYIQATVPKNGGTQLPLPVDFYSDNKGQQSLVELTKNNPTISHINMGDKDEFLLGWQIPAEVTERSGKVQLSLRYVELDENNQVSYAIGTKSITFNVENADVFDPTNSIQPMNPPANVIEKFMTTLDDFRDENGMIQIGNYANLSGKPFISIGGQEPIEMKDGAEFKFDEELKNSSNAVQNKVVFATVNEINQSIETNQDNIDSLNADVAKLSTRIAANATSITGTQTSLNSLSNTVATLSNTVNSNQTDTTTRINNLTKTVSDNKTSADKQITNLSNTVATNKTAAETAIAKVASDAEAKIAAAEQAANTKITAVTQTIEELEYSDLNNLPTIVVDGQEYTVGKDEIVVSKVTVDTEVSDTSENPIANSIIKKYIDEKEVVTDEALNATSKNPVANSAVFAAIKNLSDKMNEMTYIPITISSFDNNVKFVKINSVLTGDISFTWTLDGNVKSQTITGNGKEAVLTTDARNHIGNFGELTNTTDFTLRVQDPQGNSTNAVTTIEFVYEVFSGATSVPEEYTADFMATLTSTLQPGKESVFTANAGANDYIYYCLPNAYKTPAFNVGGFVGGFTKVASVEHNATTYDIYRSDNINLGDTTVTVV